MLVGVWVGVFVGVLVGSRHWPSTQTSMGWQHRPPQASASGQQISSAIHTAPPGQHSPSQHCASLAQQSSPQAKPAQGGLVVGIVVGVRVGVGRGARGVGIVGREPVSRAVESARMTLPTAAVPPRPSSPLRMVRREAPEAR
jgi:hypothetical protein